MNEMREFRSGDYRYTVENDEVTITQYTGNDAEVTVPGSIKGMPVVAIDTTAFHHCDNMRSVTIPDSVVRIGGLAFSKCYALEHVTLGRGIREIDFSPFSFCEKMIYNKYENGYYVGNEENPYLALVSMASEDAETVTIHPDTVVVCGSAMEGCSSLRELFVSDAVVSIGSFAFSYCSSLETLYIPESVESIGHMAFEHCDSLLNIVVSDKSPHFKSVDGSLFSHDGTRLIKYTAGKNVSSYSIPNGVLIIEDFAFENAKQLTEVVLSDSVEEIGHSAFIHCENLRNIQLGNSLKRIGGQAFGFCSSLTAITIPDSVEELSYSVFSYCDNLESAVIGCGVIQLDKEIFEDCDALSEVTFRDSDGWKVKAEFSIRSEKVDLSDPRKNADYLTGEYCEYYWHKK
jgi:NAD-dependent dihydropyrimidine dehydrogenase PreA subunit